ncbi:MAG: hypothetical protein AAGA60_17235 [Cyanobacteria bacterium P01_E01_bin.42]
MESNPINSDIKTSKSPVSLSLISPETLEMMQLAETGFSEWNDPEEDIYSLPPFDLQTPMNTPLISDTQALIVKAFLVALSQQDTIPQGLPNNLRAIARDLSKNIEAIDAIAAGMPALATDYNWAYKFLVERAEKRGMGLDFPPDGSPDATLPTDIENSVPDPNQRPKIADILQKLEQMDNAALTDKTRDIFMAADPLEELKTAFNLGQYGF